MQKNIVICGYKRSPFHFANKGALAKVRPDDMAATVLNALLSETGVNKDDIEDFTWMESDCEELVGSITGENGAEILISAFRSRRSISGREMDG